MKYETDYVFECTYHKPNSKYCYTETKHFDSELERNTFALACFAAAISGEIVLEFAQKSDLQTWQKSS